MKVKIILVGFLALVAWWLKPAYYIDPFIGSVNKKIVKFAMKDCLLGFNQCKSSFLISDATNFKWDTVYLLPYNFFGGEILIKENSLEILPTGDFLQMEFFFQGKNIHNEFYRHGSVNLFSMIDAEYIANQIIFFDSPHNNPLNELGSINVKQSNIYFKCTRKSSFRIQKLLPAKNQWPGKIALVTPEHCEAHVAF